MNILIDGGVLDFQTNTVKLEMTDKEIVSLINSLHDAAQAGGTLIIAFSGEQADAHLEAQPEA